ncbi:hypothetical protein KAW18_13655 [candidate division WOR-3 bacterium]|nr:hypothetical protein [candidate division WOR-3 bacterium]
MNEEESQQTIECKAAIRAALEKVGEYCGLGEMERAGHTIKFAGATIEYPEEIYQIAIDETLEYDDRIGKIAASEWTVKQAVELEREIEASSSLLAGMVSVDQVAASLAEKIVKPIRT